MYAMQVNLSVAGPSSGRREVAALAKAMRDLADAQALLKSNRAGLDSLIPRITTTQLDRLERTAAAYQSMAASGKALAGNPPAVPSVTGGRGGGGGGAGAGMVSGPNRKLLRLSNMERKLAAMPDGPEKDAGLADLPILRFRAERSRVLGERRVREGDSALQAAGLLDLFRELNGLLKGGGLSPRMLSRGIQLVGGGGLNIQQKVAGAALGNAAGAAANAAGSGAGAAAGAAGAGALSGLAGIAEVAVPVVAGLALLAAGVKILTEVIASSASTIGGINNARIGSGGSTGQVTALMAMGLSPGAIPGMARGLRERAGSDPFTMRLLGPQIDRRFGGGNEAALLQNAVQLIASATGAEERRTLAIQLDLESLLPSIEAYRRHKQAVDEDGRVLALVAQGQGAAAADFQLATARFSQNWDALVAELGSPFISAAADLIGGVADELRGLTEMAHAARPALEFATLGLRGLMEASGLASQGFGELAHYLALLIDATTGNIGAVRNDLENLRKGNMAPLKSAKDDHTDALKDSAQATRDLTLMMREVFNGGGERSRSAMPDGLRASALNDYLRGGLNGARFALGATL